MMIAARFRTVVGTACIASAALGCYLVSLRVASERAEAARLDRSLVVATQEARQLATELGTRSRLVQLERWNADVLALTAPKAAQYLTGEMQLASLAVPATDADAVATPAAQALQAPATVAQVAYAPVAADRPASRLLHSVSLSLDAGDAAFRPAALVGGALAATGRRIAYLDVKSPRP